MNPVESGTKAPPFEESLKRLEATVKKLEKGDLPLEESLHHFEEGIRLSRLCMEQLNTAEKRVELLLKDKENRFLTRAFEEVEPSGKDVE
ncbi:MAG: exodeoxyribonuclease VII small subunit [Deltaproteobacteria bacterium]|nr:exodeoxyribonuclease VII small subunit [Deltaproteobacteria bacterium]